MKNMKTSSLRAEFIPAKIESEKLLVVLHGLGDSAFGYHFLPGVLGIPDLSYLLVNAPDPYFGGYSWFDLMDPAPGILRSRDKLTKLFSEINRNGYQYQDIALLGFSQGALMSLDIAARFSEKLAGIVAISGFAFFLEKLPEELSSVAKEQKILATHGLYDSMLPITASRAQITELGKFGLNIRWKEYAKDHTIDPEKEIQDIRNFLLTQLNLL